MYNNKQNWKSKLRKSTVRRLILSLVLVLLISFGIGLYNYTKQTAEPSLVIPKSEQRVQALNDTPEEQAIARVQGYLIDNFDNIDPNNRLVLDYLYRKFMIEPAFSVKQKPIDYLAKDPNAKKEFLALKRIAYPQSLVMTIPVKEAEDSSSFIVMSAANCDRIALPDGFDKLMLKNIQKGGYDMTHAALASIFLKDNNCQMENLVSINAMLVKQLAMLAEENSAKQDLRYEAIAFLLHMNRPDQIKSQLINDVLLSQKTDGGWSNQANGTNSNDHTSVLSLWLLLEKIRPDTPDQPIINRPERT